MLQLFHGFISTPLNCSVFTFFIPAPLQFIPHDLAGEKLLGIAQVEDQKLLIWSERRFITHDLKTGKDHLKYEVPARRTIADMYADTRDHRIWVSYR